MDHEGRMALALRVTDYVRRRHPEVIAVAVHGSTATSEDREHSDLEMFAIIRGQSETRGYGVIHEGIVVEIELISEQDATREAGRTGNWPMSADGWIHTVPIHDPENVLPRFAALASNPDPATLASSAAGMVNPMYEDLCKIRNFLAAGEESLARVMCHGFALHGVAPFVAFLNRQHFNGIRNLLTKPREFSILPPHFWEDYPGLLAVDGETRELAVRAERLYGECRAILASAGQTIPDGLSLEEKLDRGRSPRTP